MNENSTTITYEKVRSNAATMKNCSEEMGNVFNAFEESVNRVGTPEAFEGEGNEAFQNKFRSLKSHFDEYTRLVNEFSNMMMTASEEEEKTEKAIASKAETLNTQNTSMPQ